MLSNQLIQIIETHWESISDLTIQHIREEPELANLRKLPASELREWAKTILKNLGRWIADIKDKAVAYRYELLGRLRFEP